MSMMHLSHIWLQWKGGFFDENLYQTLEAGVHFFLGLVTGFLSEKYLRTAEKLKQSYQDLRDKTLQVLNAEEQLRRTERVQALAELSAGVAHEIRTPLSAIKGAAEILTSSKLSPEQREEFRGILMKETRHLNYVVNEFLDFARPKPQRKTYCNLEKIIDSVLELTAQQRSSHNIKVTKNYEQNLPSIYFDPDLLKQVFVNLITNASQMMLGAKGKRSSP